MPELSIRAIWDRLAEAHKNGVAPHEINSLYADLGYALWSQSEPAHLGEYVVQYQQPGSDILDWSYLGADGYGSNEPVYFKTLDEARLAIARSEGITGGDSYSVRQIQLITDLFRETEVEYHGRYNDPITPIPEEEAA